MVSGSVFHKINILKTFCLKCNLPIAILNKVFDEQNIDIYLTF